MAELQLSVVDRSGASRRLETRSGELLMAVLRDQVDIEIGTCGGAISCGTCLVVIDEAWAARLPPASQDELEMLEALDAPPGARLSCQVAVSDALDGLALRIAPES